MLPLVAPGELLAGLDFYTMGTSSLADIAKMNAMSARQSCPNRDEWLKRLEEIIALFEDAEALGRDIARRRPSDQG